jgi:hypothetical protein
MQIGCQTFRKMGYLFAIFGDANSINLQTSARHATEKISAKHLGEKTSEIEIILAVRMKF